MTQRKPLCAQLCLELGARNASLEGRKSALRVDVEHPVHPAQIDRQRGSVTLEGIHVAHNTRAPSKRDRRGSPAMCTIEELVDLFG